MKEAGNKIMRHLFSLLYVNFCLFIDLDVLYKIKCLLLMPSFGYVYLERTTGQF